MPHSPTPQPIPAAVPADIPWFCEEFVGGETACDGGEICCDSVDVVLLVVVLLVDVLVVDVLVVDVLVLEVVEIWWTNWNNGARAVKVLMLTIREVSIAAKGTVR